MNIDDIKKGLECCSNPSINSCKDCPYNNNGEFSCCDGEMCKDALNLITEQEKEIEQLKAEFKQLETNAEILARGVRDLNHENYELTEKIKQAKIDVLNRLKSLSIYDDNYLDGYVFIDDIDKLLEEYENDT